MKKYGITGDSQRKRESKGLSIVLARGRHDSQSSVVAHRQETILPCDRILVLDDGRLNYAAQQPARATESAR